MITASYIKSNQTLNAYDGRVHGQARSPSTNSVGTWNLLRAPRAWILYNLLLDYPQGHHPCTARVMRRYDIKQKAKGQNNPERGNVMLSNV